MLGCCTILRAGASNVKPSTNVETCPITLVAKRIDPYPIGKLHDSVVNDVQLTVLQLVVLSMIIVGVVSMPAKFNPNSDTCTPPVFGPLYDAANVVTGAS